MFSKTLFIAAFTGLSLVLAYEGNLFKTKNYQSGHQTNSINKADTSEPKTDYFTIDNVCQDQLNEQIQLEMHSSLSYMNMAAHFNNPNVAHYGLGKFYKKAAIEEQDHATQIIDYINRRGGKVKTLKVDPSLKSNFTNMLESLEYALKLENIVNNELHLLHRKAELECNDSHLMDFIEGVFFDEQIKAIHQLKSWITKLQRMGDGLGEYMLDDEISKAV